MVRVIVTPLLVVLYVPSKSRMVSCTVSRVAALWDEGESASLVGGVGLGEEKCT